MATLPIISQDQKGNMTGQMAYIDTDGLSPNMIMSDDSLLWPVNLLKTDEVYFNSTEILPTDGSESITEDGTESVGWRDVGWSEDEENVW